MVTSDPSSAVRILREAFELDDDRPSSLNIALLCGFLTREDFASLIPEALKNRDGECQADVIAHASLQFPDLFSPYLKKMFDDPPNAETYYETWPWRAANEAEVARLQRTVLSKAKLDKRQFAWECLLETSRPDVLAWVSRNMPPETSGYPLAQDPAYWLQSVGQEFRDGKLRQLYPESCYHIIFPADYVSDDGTSRPHPTWQLPTAKDLTCTFGGTTGANCQWCSSPLMHVMTLDPIPAPLGIRSVKRLAMIFCINCGQMDDTFFEHNEQGELVRMVRSKKEEPYNWKAFKTCSVQLAETPARWQQQDWALANDAENLNRIGGRPTWIQSWHYPACPRCKTMMTFLAQFSVDNFATAPGDGQVWGLDTGLLYALFCDTCRIVKWTSQMT